MSTDDGADVALSTVRIAAKLGDGGQGEVHELTGPGNLLYKRYRTRNGLNADSLTALVQVRRRLPAADRAYLDAATAWPLCRVVDGGHVTGFLMRRAPRTMSWTPPDGGPRKLTELAFLLRPPKDAWRTVRQPDPAQRHALIVALVELLGRLHRLNLIVGDISQANILWTLDPAPAVFLLDCDGIREVSRPPVLPQADTMDWHDPLAPAHLVTMDSDRYKAALAVLRLLARNPYLTPGEPFTPLPGVLDGRQEAAVRRLATAAAGPHGTRPDLGQWLTALTTGRGTVRLAPVRPEPPPTYDPTVFGRRGPRPRLNLTPDS